MKYIFFGTPDFAAIILEKLIAAGMIPAVVVTNPDRPAGRKKSITPPPVKQYLLKWNFNRIEILQPENLSALRHSLLAIQPEVGILAAYGKIIPQEIMAVFPKGIIVVHPSLLPLYRGATPIQTAILNGDVKTGTTLFVMDEKIDHGSILANSTVHIAYSDTYETLMKKLAEASADLLLAVIPKYMRGELLPQAQDEARATSTKKFTSEDGFVDYGVLEIIMGTSNAPRTFDVQKSAETVWRMVRALNPEPGVWTIAKGGRPSFAPSSGATEGQRRMKILEADVVDGKLVLRKIQFAGEKPKNI